MSRFKQRVLTQLASNLEKEAGLKDRVLKALGRGPKSKPVKMQKLESSEEVRKRGLKRARKSYSPPVKDLEAMKWETTPMGYKVWMGPGTRERFLKWRKKNPKRFEKWEKPTSPAYGWKRPRPQKRLDNLARDARVSKQQREDTERLRRRGLVHPRDPFKRNEYLLKQDRKLLDNLGVSVYDKSRYHADA